MRLYYKWWVSLGMALTRLDATYGLLLSIIGAWRKACGGYALWVLFLHVLAIASAGGVLTLMVLVIVRLYTV